MQTPAWYPYAPDQAFGQQAARDEELVDTLLAQLDAQRRQSPRAGNKARLSAVEGGTWQPATDPLALFGNLAGDAPLTMAIALEAAPLLQQE